MSGATNSIGQEPLLELPLLAERLLAQFPPAASGQDVGWGALLLAPKSRVGETSTESWMAQLERVGFRVQPLPGSLLELDRMVGPRCPAMYLAPGGVWTLVVEAKLGRYCIETVSEHRKWVTADELAVRWSMLPTEVSDRFFSIETALEADAVRHAHHHDHGSPVGPFRTWFKMEKPDIIAVLLYACGIGLLNITTPVAVQSLVSTVAFGTVLQPLLVLAIVLAVALLIQALLHLFQTYLVEVLQQRFFVRVVSDLSHRLPRSRTAAWANKDMPEHLNRYFDVFTVQKAVATVMLTGLEFFLTTLVGLILLAFYHPWLLAFDVLLVGLIGLTLLPVRRGVATAIEESKVKYRLAGWFQRVGRRGLKGPRNENEQWVHYGANALARQYIQARQRHFRILFGQTIGVRTIQAVSSAVLLGVGGLLVIDRQLTLGQLIAAELIVTTAVTSLAKFGKVLETYYDLVAGMDKVGHLIDLDVDPIEPASMQTRGAETLQLVLPEGLGDRQPPVEHIDLLPGSNTAILGRAKHVSAALHALSGWPDGSVLGASVLRKVGLVRMEIGEVLPDGLFVERAPRFPESVAEIFAGRGVSLVGAVTALEKVRASRLARASELELELNADGTQLDAEERLRVQVAEVICKPCSYILFDRTFDGYELPLVREMVLLIKRECARSTIVVGTTDDRVARLFDEVVDLERSTS